MPILKAPPADWFICTNSEPHAWMYRRNESSYFCPRCKAYVSKTDLKDHTD